MTPYDLDQGLSLERSGYLLPWGASRAELLRLGDPKEFPNTICWEDELVFGGVEVSVRTDSILDGDQFSLYLAAVDPDIQSAKYEAVYYEGVDVLSTALGPPNESDEGGGIVWTDWVFGEVRVTRWYGDTGKGMLVGTFVSRHSPEGYLTGSGLDPSE